MVSTLFSTVYVLVCLLLLMVVLLQQGKGGDIAAAFGGGSSQTAFGARASATVLTRATTVLGALFMLAALALAIMGQRGGSSSVVGSVPAPAPAQQTAPATATPPQAAPVQQHSPAADQKPAQPPAPEKK